MHVQDEIDAYIAAQPASKRADLEALHALVTGLLPGCRLWFLDGRDAQGRTVTNPNIGYGLQELRYADGSSRPFYQIGVSGNTSGISVYIMGLKDKAYLAETYGARLGKARVTGYCVRFKRLADVDVEVLAEAVRDGAAQTQLA